MPQRTVADWIASFSENGSEDDSAIFRDFEPELYTGQTPRARAARIAEQVGVPRQTVADWIANFAEIDPEADSGIFRDFEPELYTGQTPRARAAPIAAVETFPPQGVANPTRYCEFRKCFLNSFTPCARELH